MNKQTENALKLLKEYNAWRRDSEGKLQIPDPTEIGLALDCVIEALELAEIEQDDNLLTIAYMSGIREGRERAEKALEQLEIGDAEIKQMLDDIEWYQQEQRKLIDRIKALEQPEGKEFFERGKEIARWADKQAQEPVSFDMQSICDKYGIRLILDDEHTDINCGGSAGHNTIMLGKFDDRDLQITAFFHELGHCLFKPVNNIWMDTLSMEGTAWEVGRAEANKYGFNWDYHSKELTWARNQLKSYTHPHQDGTSPSGARDKEFATLTDDEIGDLITPYEYSVHPDLDGLARAIEAKLKEKNT